MIFPSTRASVRGFSFQEALVSLAVILVLFAIGYPIYTAKQKRSHQQVALEKIRLLGGAVSTYANQNGGALPDEDCDGNDTWDNIANPKAKEAWYNALPRLAGRRPAGEFAPENFYTDENVLFLPGANYPDKKKFIEPMFAIAFNTKLQRTNADGSKPKTMLSQITLPARTVVLLEQGLLNESRTLAVQTKKDYDGSPKGSAKSFVGRYDGQGVLFFLDGHAELVPAKDVLNEFGKFPFPQANFVWTRTPEEDPNKDGTKTAKN